MPGNTSHHGVSNARRRDRTLAAHAVISTVDVHPESRGRIEGTPVSFFCEALAVCKRTHQLIGRAPLIGWDVAITAEGPILVEGNHMFRKSHRSPMGRPSLSRPMSPLRVII